MIERETERQRDGGERDIDRATERMEGMESMNKRYTSNFLKLINQQFVSQSMKYTIEENEKNVLHSFITK